MKIPRSVASVPWPLWLLLAGSIGLMVWSWNKEPPTRDGVGTRHPRVGSQLGALELTGLDPTDRTVGLSDLQGRVSVINFWGTWCGYCRVELPPLSRELDAFSAHADFQFLPISYSIKGPPENLPKLAAASGEFLEAHSLSFPVYADEHGKTIAAADQAVGFGGFPTTIVLDRQGKVRGVWEGYVSGEEHHVAQLVNELLEAKSATKATN